MPINKYSQKIERMNGNDYSPEEKKLIKKWFPFLKEERIQDSFLLKDKQLSISQIKLIKLAGINVSDISKLVEPDFFAGLKMKDNDKWILLNSLRQTISEKVIDIEQKIKERYFGENQGLNNDQDKTVTISRLPIASTPQFATFIENTKDINELAICGAHIYYPDLSGSGEVKCLQLSESETAIFLSDARNVLNKINVNRDKYFTRYEEETSINTRDYEVVRNYFYSKIVKNKIWRFLKEKEVDLNKVNKSEFDIELRFTQKKSSELSQEQKSILNDPEKLIKFFEGNKEKMVEQVRDEIALLDEFEIVDISDIVSGNGRNGKSGARNGNSRGKNFNPIAEQMARHRMSKTSTPYTDSIVKNLLLMQESQNTPVNEHLISLSYLHKKGLLTGVKKVLSLACGPHEELQAYGRLKEKNPDLEIPQLFNLDITHQLLNENRQRLFNNKSVISGLGIDICSDAKYLPFKSASNFDMIECSSWDDIATGEKENEEGVVKKILVELFGLLNRDGLIKFYSYKKYTPEFLALLKDFGFEIVFANSKLITNDSRINNKAGLKSRPNVWLIAKKKNDVSVDELSRALTDIKVYQKKDKIKKNNVPIDTTIEIDQENETLSLADRYQIKEGNDFAIYLKVVKNPLLYINDPKLISGVIVSLEKVLGQIDIVLAKELFEKYSTHESLYKFLPWIIKIARATGRPEKVINNVEIIAQLSSELSKDFWSLFAEFPQHYFPMIMNCSKISDSDKEKYLNSFDWENPNLIEQIEKYCRQNWSSEDQGKQKILGIIFSKLGEQKLDLPIGMRFVNWGIYRQYSLEEPKNEKEFSEKEYKRIFTELGWRIKLVNLPQVLDLAKKTSIEGILFEEMVNLMLLPKEEVRQYLRDIWSDNDDALGKWLIEIAKKTNNYQLREKIIKLLNIYEQNNPNILTKLNELNYQSLYESIINQYQKRGTKIDNNQLKVKIEQSIGSFPEFREWLFNKLMWQVGYGNNRWEFCLYAQPKDKKMSIDTVIFRAICGDGCIDSCGKILRYSYISKLVEDSKTIKEYFFLADKFNCLDREKIIKTLSNNQQLLDDREIVLLICKEGLYSCKEFETTFLNWLKQDINNLKYLIEINNKLERCGLSEIIIKNFDDLKEGNNKIILDLLSKGISVSLSKSANNCLIDEIFEQNLLDDNNYFRFICDKLIPEDIEKNNQNIKIFSEWLQRNPENLSKAMKIINGNLFLENLILENSDKIKDQKLVSEYLDSRINLSNRKCYGGSRNSDKIMKIIFDRDLISDEGLFKFVINQIDNNVQSEYFAKTISWLESHPDQLIKLSSLTDESIWIEFLLNNFTLTTFEDQKRIMTNLLSISINRDLRNKQIKLIIDSNLIDESEFEEYINERLHVLSSENLQLYKDRISKYPEEIIKLYKSIEGRGIYGSSNQANIAEIVLENIQTFGENQKSIISDLIDRTKCSSTKEKIVKTIIEKSWLDEEQYFDYVCFNSNELGNIELLSRQIKQKPEYFRRTLENMGSRDNLAWVILDNIDLASDDKKDILTKIITKNSWNAKVFNKIIEEIIKDNLIEDECFSDYCLKKSNGLSQDILINLVKSFSSKPELLSKAVDYASNDSNSDLKLSILENSDISESDRRKIITQLMESYLTSDDKNRLISFILNGDLAEDSQLFSYACRKVKSDDEKNIEIIFSRLKGNPELIRETINHDLESSRLSDMLVSEIINHGELYRDIELMEYVFSHGDVLAKNLAINCVTNDIINSHDRNGNLVGKEIGEYNLGKRIFIPGSSFFQNGRARDYDSGIINFALDLKEKTYRGDRSYLAICRNLQIGDISLPKEISVSISAGVISGVQVLLPTPGFLRKDLMTSEEQEKLVNGTLKAEDLVLEIEKFLNRDNKKIIIYRSINLK